MADEIENSSAAAEGSTVETPAAPVKEPEFDRAALEAKVSKGLAALRDEPAEPAAEPKPAAEEPAAEPVEEPATAEAAVEEPAEPDEEPKEGEEKPEQQPEAKKPTGPTLPAAYRRSLKAYDWSDEEIDSAFKANPAEFTVTAQRLHSNRNTELARWADAGRAARTAQEQAAPREKPAPSPHLDTTKGTIKPVDVAAMVEKYGNEELVTEIAGPVNAAIELINAVLPDLMTGVQSIHASRQDTLTRQIDGFFGGDELKSYAEFYGQASASMTEPQVQNRNKVLELADSLIAGAAQQGRKLTTDEALTLAHDSVSGGFKVQAIRKDIKTKVAARGKGLTLKPSTAQGKGPAGGPVKNAAELESRTKSRLAAVFGA